MIASLTPSSDPEEELLRLARALPPPELERLREYIAALAAAHPPADLQNLARAGQAVAGLQKDHKLATRLPDMLTYLEALSGVRIAGPLGELTKLTGREEKAASDLAKLLNGSLGKDLDTIGELARQVRLRNNPETGWKL